MLLQEDVGENRQGVPPLDDSRNGLQGLEKHFARCLY
jgi:hypothetical protein